MTNRDNQTPETFTDRCPIIVHYAEALPWRFPSWQHIRAGDIDKSYLEEWWHLMSQPRYLCLVMGDVFSANYLPLDSNVSCKG